MAVNGNQISATVQTVDPSTPDGRWTLGLIPRATWPAAAAARGFPTMGVQYTEIHHMFPSMLLTNALRRSGF